MKTELRVDEQGGVLIPPEFLTAAGLKPGDNLLIEVVGEGELRLYTRRRALKDAQAIIARYIPKDRDHVAELIGERRAEAERE